jgi:hypothetical protein
LDVAEGVREILGRLELNPDPTATGLRFQNLSAKQLRSRRGRNLAPGGRPEGAFAITHVTFSRRLTDRGSAAAARVAATIPMDLRRPDS